MKLVHRWCRSQPYQQPTLQSRCHFKGNRKYMVAISPKWYSHIRKERATIKESLRYELGIVYSNLLLPKSMHKYIFVVIWYRTQRFSSWLIDISQVHDIPRFYINNSNSCIDRFQQLKDENRRYRAGYITRFRCMELKDLIENCLRKDKKQASAIK